MGALRLVPIKVNIYPYRKMYLAFLAGMKLEGGRDFLLAWKQLNQSATVTTQPMKINHTVNS